MHTETIHLRGITWNHSRGYTPMVATAQRYSELHPGVEISWAKRSLQAFADEPIDQLASKFDFLVIDHPWAGFAAKTGVITALDKYIPKDFIEDQASNSVGKSNESYRFDGHQWALAIDAATPVAASRPDLFDRHKLQLPTTFQDLIDLSKTGRVAIPGIPQDTLMSFYMICSTLGENVCSTEEHVISEHTGLHALELLRQLGQNINRECYDWNPIKVYEAMSQTDAYIYSPFAYGYTNYARIGYAQNMLKFHDMVAIDNQKLITTLGGTGLAVSANCAHLKEAIHYAQYVASPTIQKSLFFDNGGQSGHRAAWTNDNTNAQTSNFFKDTLPALDRAFLRPRYHGHMYFQDRAGKPIREYMMNGGNSKDILQLLNNLYHESLKIK